MLYCKLYYWVNPLGEDENKEEHFELNERFWILWWIESWKPAMRWVWVWIIGQITLSSCLSVLSKGDFIGFGEWVSHEQTKIGQFLRLCKGYYSKDVIMTPSFGRKMGDFKGNIINWFTY